MSKKSMEKTWLKTKNKKSVFKLNPLVTALANIVPNRPMTYLPLKQWKFFLALPFNVGAILAYGRR